MNVCLVDDNPRLLDVMSRTVNGLGHTVVPALTVRALGEALSAGVDAVVIDIQAKPERIDLVLAARKARPDIRLIATSRSGQIRPQDVRDIARALGADAILTNPNASSEVEQALLPASAPEKTPMTAQNCRTRARELFEAAVFEEDEATRERYLTAGEKWMRRWRVWSEASVYHADDDGLTLPSPQRPSHIPPYRFGQTPS